LATALTQPKWFSIRGGVCGRKFVGLQLFIELNTHSTYYPSSPVSLLESIPDVKSHFLVNNTSNSVDSDIIQDIIDRNHELNHESDHESNHESKNDTKTERRRDTSGENMSDEPLPQPQSSIFSPFDPAVAVFPDNFEKLFNGSLLSNHRVLNGTDPTKVKNSRKRGNNSNVKSGTPLAMTRQDSNGRFTNSRKPKYCSFIDILPLQRMVILLCLVAIMLNLSQFFLDTLGTSKKLLNLLRLHGVGSILGVVLTIVIIGFSYMIAAMIELDERAALTQLLTSSNPGIGNLFASNHPGMSHPGIPLALPAASFSVANHTKDFAVLMDGQHLEVRFELSFYLVTLSGLVGLMAAACNLLRRPVVVPFFPPPPQHHHTSLLLDPLLFSDMDDPPSPIWTGGGGHTPSMRVPRLLIGLPPPPPPYSP